MVRLNLSNSFCRALMNQLIVNSQMMSTDNTKNTHTVRACILHFSNVALSPYLSRLPNLEELKNNDNNDNTWNRQVTVSKPSRTAVGTAGRTFWISSFSATSKSTAGRMPTNCSRNPTCLKAHSSFLKRWAVPFSEYHS